MKQQNPYFELNKYELGYLVQHLIESNKFSEAIEELTCFDHIMARLEVLSDKDSIASIGRDWERLKAKTELTDNANAWERFWTANEHQLMHAEADWPAYKIFLQLAWEHANDSPVTKEAELWLEDGMCTWKWLRLKPGFRPSSCSDKGIDKILSFDDPPTCFAVSRRSNRMVIGTVSGDVNIWDTQTKKCKLKIGTESRVSAVAIADNGQICISAHGDTLAVWNLKTKDPKQRMLYEFDGHKGLIRNVSITPDGKWAISSGADKKVRIWDLLSGKCNNVLDMPGLNPVYKISVAITADGNYAIVGGVHEWAESASRDLFDLYLKEINTGDDNFNEAMKELDELEAKIAADLGVETEAKDDPTDKFIDDVIDSTETLTHNAITEAAAISEDYYGPDFNEYKGEYLQLWDLKKSERIQACKDEMSNTVELMCLDLTVDDKYVITAENNDVCIKDRKTLKNVKKLIGHSTNVIAISVDHNSKYIVSSSNDSVRIWDISTGKCLKELTSFGGAEGVQFLPSEESIAVLRRDLRLCFLNSDFGGTDESTYFNGHESDQYGALPMISLVVNTSESQTLSIDSKSHGVLACDFSGMNSQYFDIFGNSKKEYFPKIAISALTNKAVCESPRDKYSLWNLECGSSPSPISWHPEWVRSVGISPDGKTAVLIDDDINMMIWDTGTQSSIKTISGSLLKKTFWPDDSFNEITYVILTNSLHTAIIYCERHGFDNSTNELYSLDLENLKIRHRIEWEDIKRLTLSIKNEQIICIAENYESRLFWNLKTGKYSVGKTDDRETYSEVWGHTERDHYLRGGTTWTGRLKPSVQFKTGERYLWHGLGSFIFPEITMVVNDTMLDELVCFAKKGFQVWANSILNNPIFTGHPIFFNDPFSVFIPKMLDLVDGNQVITSDEIRCLLKPYE